MSTVAQMIGALEMSISALKPTQDLPTDRRILKYALDIGTTQAIAARIDVLKSRKQWEGRDSYSPILFSTHTVTLEAYQGNRRGTLPTSAWSLPDYNDGLVAVRAVNECTGLMETMDKGTEDSVQYKGLPYQQPEYLREGNYLFVYGAPLLETIQVKLVGGDGSILAAQVEGRSWENAPYPCPSELESIAVQQAANWLKGAMAGLNDTTNNHQNNLLFQRPVVYQGSPQQTA